MTYEEFLKTKEIQSINDGIKIDTAELNDALFDFQKDIVAWALQKGRAAVFSDCGTGKSLMQLEFARVVSETTGCKSLIIAPLSVVKQTEQEGRKFGIKTKVCRQQADVVDGVNITNYDMLSHFDADAFGCVVLDESSILKSFTSKTRDELIDKFQMTGYRLCCTATPSPNDQSEIGNHAEFLGIMSRSEMLATYFIHDGSDTSKWRLKGYGEKRFWEWVATWAVCVRTPEDLGYSNEGYELPDLNLIEHIVKSKVHDYELFARLAETLSERRIARKESMADRVKVAKDLCKSSKEQWLVWCDYNAESTALAQEIEGGARSSRIRQSRIQSGHGHRIRGRKDPRAYLKAIDLRIRHELPILP